MNKPQYPFGSCQYDNVYADFIRFKADPRLRAVKPRDGFTREIVLLLLNAASDAAHDLWSAADHISDLAIENMIDFDSLIEFDGDYDPHTGLECALLAVCFNLEYADFPKYST